MSRFLSIFKVGVLVTRSISKGLLAGKFQLTLEDIFLLILWAWSFPFRIGQSLYFYCFPFQTFGVQQSLQLANDNELKGISLKICRTSIFKIYTIGTAGWIVLKVTAIVHAIHFLSTVESQDVFKNELFNCLNMIAFLFYTCGLQFYGFIRLDKLVVMLELIMKQCMDYIAIIEQVKKFRTEEEVGKGHGEEDLQSIAIIMLCLIWISVWIAPFLGFGVFYLLENELMFQMYQTSNIVCNLVISSIIAYWIALDMTLICCYAHTYIVYAGFLLESLKMLLWQPGASSIQRKDSRKIYRRLQLQHSLAMEAGAPIIAGMFIAGTIFVISAFYIVIRFHSSLSLFYLLVINVEGIGFIFAISICISLGYSVRQASINYPTSFLKNSKNLKPKHKKWFKSCQPIAMYVGNIFPITTRVLFLEIFSFMLENVMSLLVAF